MRCNCEKMKGGKRLSGNISTPFCIKVLHYESVEAHYLRILPSAYHGAVCMRMEVFGVKRKPGYYTML